MGNRGSQCSCGLKALVWILLLVSSCYVEGQAFVISEETTLPIQLVDYELLNAPSVCACRVICAANLSCTGVTARSNNGQLECLFSDVVLQQSQLLISNAANTWISTGSHDVPRNGSLTSTVATVVLASTTVLSSAVPNTTTATATTVVTSTTASPSPSNTTPTVATTLTTSTPAASPTPVFNTTVVAATTAGTETTVSTAITNLPTSTVVSSSTAATATSESATAASATPSTVPVTTTVAATTVTTATVSPTTTAVLSTTASTTVTTTTTPSSTPEETQPTVASVTTATSTVTAEPETTKLTTTTQPPQTTTTTAGVRCSAGQYPWINEVERTCLQFSSAANTYGGAYLDCSGKGGAHFRPRNSQDMQNMIAFIRQLNTGKSYWARVYYMNSGSRLETYTGIYQDTLIWAAGQVGGTTSDSAFMNPTTDYKLTKASGSDTHYYICALPEATASG